MLVTWVAFVTSRLLPPSRLDAIIIEQQDGDLDMPIIRSSYLGRKMANGTNCEEKGGGGSPLE